MMNGGGLLSLKWHNHKTSFFYVLSNLRSKECYTDVTLACDGKFYPVHKLILSTCSEYFEQMFEQTQCKHPVIVLKDIRSEELESLLSYMYVGEVNVVQEKLSGLIKAAECLRIKGLAVPDEEPQPTKSSAGSREKRTSDNSLSSEAKRRRQDNSGFSSQKQISSSSSREDSNWRRVDQSSSNKFSRNNASSSSSSGSVNSSRDNRENSEQTSSARDVAQSDEQQPSAASEAADDEIELKAEEPPDPDDDLHSDMPPSDAADSVKQEPIDLDAVYLSDSNSTSETKDIHVEESFVEDDSQQHFMDELLGQSSASDQHAVFQAGLGENLPAHQLLHETLSSKPWVLTNHTEHEVNTRACLSSDLNCSSTAMPLETLDLMSLQMSDGVYKCPVCLTHIKHLHHFKRHYKIHRETRPHACSHCPYRSWRRNNLRAHVFRKHGVQ